MMRELFTVRNGPRVTICGKWENLCNTDLICHIYSQGILWEPHSTHDLQEEGTQQQREIKTSDTA